MSIDLQAIKQTQQKVWPAGDYHRITNFVNLMTMSDAICEAAYVLPHHQVLDVASGTGNTAIAAARRGFPAVTAMDFAPELLELARARARVDGLDIAFETGDAENMDYADNSFDIVLSTCGVMFAPDQEKAASELVRVCRPGGRIGITAWTPDSVIGQFTKTIGSYVPPPSGVSSPLLWGTEDRLKELFGDRVRLQIEEKNHIMHTRSPEYFVETFLTSYGPAIAAFNRIDESDQSQFVSDLNDVVSNLSRPVEDSSAIPASYLEIVCTVR